MTDDSANQSDDRTYTMDELSTAAQVTPRTVRYYIAEGLLPPPPTIGRNAAYSQEHLDRLLAINTMKEMYLPLKEIRARLNTLTREQMRDPAQVMAMGAMVRADRASERDPRMSAPSSTDDSAADYLERHAPRQPRPAPRQAYAAAPPPPLSRPTPRSVDTWERFPVTRDAELLIRSDRVERMGAALHNTLFEIGQLIENAERDERNRS